MKAILSNRHQAIAAFVVTTAITGCGNAEHGASHASPNGGRTTGTGGGPTAGGSATGGLNAGGSGGSSAGRAGSAAGGTSGSNSCASLVEFDIQLPSGTDPKLFCMDCGQLSFGYADGSGKQYPPQVNCNGVVCGTCQYLGCPAAQCQALPFPADGARFRWTGQYFGASSCGDNVPCQEPRCAPDGAYVATFCATRGVVNDLGCVRSTDPPSCVSAPFDLPSSAPISLVLPP
jgi:hypothetical protein